MESHQDGRERQQAAQAARRRQAEGASDGLPTVEGPARPEAQGATASGQACTRCGTRTPHDAILFADDGPVCVSCFDQGEADAQDVARELTRGPMQSAAFSLACSALFWAPMAGIAFTALAWTLALHAVRESWRMLGRLREHPEVSMRIRFWAGAAVVITLVALVAAGFATRGLYDLMTVLPYTVDDAPVRILPLR